MIFRNFLGGKRKGKGVLGEGIGWGKMRKCRGIEFWEVYLVLFIWDSVFGLI